LLRTIEHGWFAVECDGVIIGDVCIRTSMHGAEALAHEADEQERLGV
jgi:hypothetical protein